MFAILKNKGSFELSNNFFVKIRNRRIYKQLLAIIITFAVGYIPFVVYLLWTIISNLPESKTSDKLLDYWFGIFSYICIRFSECLDPFMYSIASSQLRNQVNISIKLFLKTLNCFVIIFINFFKFISSKKSSI